MTTLPWEDADLSTIGTIEEIVKVYVAEVGRIREAYAILGEAEEHLTIATGREATYRDIHALPRNCHSVESSCEEVLLEIRAGTWKNLIDRLGIRRILSLSRLAELDKRLDDKKNLPEIEVNTIFETFDILIGNLQEFAKEAINEVYRAIHITPHESEYWHSRQLKTNLRNASEDIGEKIILEGYVRNQYGGGVRMDYGRHTDTIIALDKVFHNLDGVHFEDKGYRSPLVDAVNTCQNGKGETDYFKFKCFSNGNLHLTFKRPDLLKQFNRIANDGTALKSGKIF